MKNLLVSLGCGVLFGAGLVISGMTNPATVQGLLGFRDPTLAVVMAAAVATCAALFAVARRRGTTPAVAERRVDARLVTGAAVFGVGWGLVGACPGPAIVSLGAGATWALVFTVAMLLGARLESYQPASAAYPPAAAPSTRRI